MLFKGSFGEILLCLFLSFSLSIEAGWKLLHGSDL